MNINSFRHAEITELDELFAIYSNCKEALLADEILQWGEWGRDYPDSLFVKKSIAEKEMYVYTVNDNPVGAVVINEKQSVEWQSIKWDTRVKNPAVLHGLVINPEHQGRGYAKSLLSLCEKWIADKNYDGVRLDAFSKNDKSNRLYIRSGYNYKGTVLFLEKPEHNREYFCYEKLIPQQSHNYV